MSANPLNINPNFSRKTGLYRYSFNGKEKDIEGMGGGSQTYDYGFRIYNPCLAKFLSVDPLYYSYPWYTPYQFAGNKPIIAIDLDGLEECLQIIKYDNDGKAISITMDCVRNIQTGKPMDLKIWERGPKFAGAEGKAVAILHLSEDGATEVSPPTFQEELSLEQEQVLNKLAKTLRVETKPGDEFLSIPTPPAYKDEFPETLSQEFDDGIYCFAKIKLNYEIKVDFVGGTDQIANDVSKELEPITKILDAVPCATAQLIGNTGTGSRLEGINYGSGREALLQRTTLNGRRDSTIGMVMIARANAVGSLIANQSANKERIGNQLISRTGEAFPTPSGRRVDVTIEIENMGVDEK